MFGSLLMSFGRVVGEELVLVLPRFPLWRRIVQELEPLKRKRDSRRCFRFLVVFAPKWFVLKNVCNE